MSLSFLEEESQKMYVKTISVSHKYQRAQTQGVIPLHQIPDIHPVHRA